MPPRIPPGYRLLHIFIPCTPFEYDVWTACAKVQSGETATYGDLARLIGRPKAVRAVARTLSNNPLPGLIPCHRIIRSDGKIGGYAFGGERVKRRLIIREARQRKVAEGT